MRKTYAQQLLNDPRIKQAKNLIKEALRDQQNNIKRPLPGPDELKEVYAKMLAQAGRLRGRDLFFPYLSSGLGKGALVELCDGSVKYDFITGIGVHYMGHSHPLMINAGIDAALEDTVMQGNLQMSSIGMQVSQLLIDQSRIHGSQLEHCFLTSSGAMANENALKVIFQKNAPASRFLAFSRCFSGRSLGMAHMTDKEQYRVGVPRTIKVDYIPFYDHLKPLQSTQLAVNTLKRLLKKNPGQYAGMCFELIQGEGGYYPGAHNFFIELMDILKEYQIAVMIDEIQTFGRTPELFAFQYFGLDEYVDVVTIGKMSHVCATLYTADYNPKPGLLSQTFTSSTSALHASKVILQEVINKGYLGPQGKIASLSDHFRRQLESLSYKYPDHISGPFGCGAMLAFTYKDGQLDQTRQFIMELYDAGVLSFVAGKDPMRVRFLMPIGAVTRTDINRVMKIIENLIVRNGDA